MSSDGWYSYENGQTLGETGTERGVIMRDEEHADGARITLERDGHTPYAITCGIYGWLVHTCFFGTEAESRQAFGAMQRELARILTLIPLESDPDATSKLPALYAAFDAFTKEFP